MANVKLSAKQELLAVATGDFVPIIDVSDHTDGSSGTSKKITVNNLVTGIVSGSVVDTGSVQSVTGEKTFTHLTILNGTTSTNAISFGSDVNLYRAASNILRTDDNLVAAGGVDYDGNLRSYSTGTPGAIKFSGTSAGAYDTNLYSPATGTLRTDGILQSQGNLVVDPDGTATPKIVLGVVANLEQNSGMKVSLLQDNPLSVYGVSGATGTIFQISNFSGTKFFDSYATGGQVFNEDGNDYDTRIEGDTDPSLVVVDASADKVGIGTNAPNEKLTVQGTLSLREGSAPSLTSSYGKIYVKSTDSLPYFMDDSGTEYSLTSRDGWEVVNDTLVYASAVTFTISGVDRTTTYTKGTRIKLTNSTVKYFVVASSAFSTNTTVTVTGGTDYALANAAITSPFYSYDINPQGYPGTFAFAPGYTGYGTPPVTTGFFSVVGNMCQVISDAALATSNANTFTMTGMPITNALTLTKIPCVIRDNGSDASAYLSFSSSGTTLVFAASVTGGVFTTSGSKGHLGLSFQYKF